MLLGVASASDIIAMTGLQPAAVRAAIHALNAKAISEVRAAVQATQYPTVKVVYPSREAIAIIKGGICTPIIPTLRIPDYAHIEYVSPYDRPCGPGKPGQPYADSAALAAITHEVQAGE